MRVVDTSALLEILLRTSLALKVEQRLFSRPQDLHVPHLVDLEIVQVLRRALAGGALSEVRANEALRDFVSLRLMRHPHEPYLYRVWELRHGVSAYDAVYVSLAESLGAPLVTCDRRLASAPGHNARVELIS